MSVVLPGGRPPIPMSPGMTIAEVRRPRFAEPGPPATLRRRSAIAAGTDRADCG